jgi:hypothetical protein
MGHGYEADFGGDKAQARLILARVGLSGSILGACLPGRFPALEICPQGLGQPLFAALGFRQRFSRLFRRFPRHSLRSHASPSI